MYHNNVELYTVCVEPRVEPPMSEGTHKRTKQLSDFV